MIMVGAWDHQGFIAHDLAEDPDEVLFRVTVQIVADAPRGPASDIRVHNARVNRGDWFAGHFCHLP